MHEECIDRFSGILTTMDELMTGITELVGREEMLKEIVRSHEYSLSIAGFKMCAECGAEESAEHQRHCKIGRALGHIIS